MQQTLDPSSNKLWCNKALCTRSAATLVVSALGCNNAIQSINGCLAHEQCDPPADDSHNSHSGKPYSMHCHCSHITIVDSNHHCVPHEIWLGKGVKHWSMVAQQHTCRWQHVLSYLYMLSDIQHVWWWIDKGAEPHFFFCSIAHWQTANRFRELLSIWYAQNMCNYAQNICNCNCTWEC